MLHSFAASSALLRTQRTALPRTFCRYKSITAAIEKGRGSGPDRFAGPRSGSRTRTSFRDDEVVSSRYDDRDGGRSRPSRSKSSIGARRRRWEDEDAAPRRKELRKSGGRSDESAVDRRIRDQDRERPARVDGDDARSGRFGDRSRRGGFDHDERAPRRTERTFDRDERAPRSRDGFQNDDRPQRRPQPAFDRDDRRSPRIDRDSRTSQPDRSSRFDRMDRTPRSAHSDRPDHSIPSRADPRDRAPDSLPYTTAASEFIYGYSSVLAAIRAQRRQFYKLYVNSRGLNRDILLARAKASNLRQITREVGDQYDRAFDKASSGRPHNGFILEASPLPVPPITELKECVKDSGRFEVVLGPQTKEELAVNGTRTSYTYKSTWRFPLILYLDGILDEGNLGAIARSAYFLGVEAIITPTRQSAPWSHIAVKASAGAAEAIPIFKVQEPAEFLGQASRNGWRCYAADAVPTSKGKDVEEESVSDIVYTQARSNKKLEHHSPVVEHPTILMMGAEGTGLKASLQNIAHYKVGIRHGREVDEVGVDSLNVSVAASLLCHDMLKRKKVAERDPENVVF
ncbi:hypothetical protein E8E12_004414 [Didymella heteroderae]|uniref:rRNA methyltransferase 1, mitochondrial n=1 Tax=Didymella heteroderae TaxID=1769908 RepID=A0A9P4WS67_9PLEO|nr:hypothetical protein E8E12_004414 [Didymella heteroderae]